MRLTFLENQTVWVFTDNDVTDETADKFHRFMKDKLNIDARIITSSGELAKELVCMPKNGVIQVMPKEVADADRENKKADEEDIRKRYRDSIINEIKQSIGDYHYYKEHEGDKDTLSDRVWHGPIINWGRITPKYGRADKK
ncbi:hypothetical protein N6G95_09520 [Pediococcus inopinatus]|uniref:hypothetical protein n=1 Tax=Pediococcus inopinatus TaxID=114090 RepID=UPI002B25AD57|nr:hypothetical protein [Pediococcus inopinatus]WPC19442.1 hypothetical protein N6G95_09520 [Pediococcus inopinatus]